MLAKHQIYVLQLFYIQMRVGMYQSNYWIGKKQMIPFIPFSGHFDGMAKILWTIRVLGGK